MAIARSPTVELTVTGVSIMRRARPYRGENTGPGKDAGELDNDTIGAIGVGGTPSGEKDEACASAGLDKIHDRLI